MARAEAKVTSKGQLTLPSKLRRAMKIEPGDHIAFDFSEGGEGRFVVNRRRSIFELIKTMPPLSTGEPLTQKDIDDAIGKAMEAKFARWSRSER